MAAAVPAGTGGGGGGTLGALSTLLTRAATLGLLVGSLAAVVALVSAGCLAAGGGAALGVRWLALRDAPVGANIPLAFDFTDWNRCPKSSASGSGDDGARAPAAAGNEAIGRPGCPSVPAVATGVLYPNGQRVLPGDPLGSDADHPFGAGRGFTSASELTFGGTGDFSMELSLNVPDTMASVGMISVRTALLVTATDEDRIALACPGRIVGDGATAELDAAGERCAAEARKRQDSVPPGQHRDNTVLVAATAAASGTVAPLGPVVAAARDVLFFLPSLLLGWDPRVQTVRFELFRLFTPQRNAPASIRLVNFTLSVAQWRPDFVLYDAQVAVNAHATGWVTSWFVYRPYLTFAVVSTIGFLLAWVPAMACVVTACFVFGGQFLGDD